MKIDQIINSEVKMLLKKTDIGEPGDSKLVSIEKVEKGLIKFEDDIKEVNLIYFYEFPNRPLELKPMRLLTLSQIVFDNSGIKVIDTDDLIDEEVILYYDDNIKSGDGRRLSGIRILNPKKLIDDIVDEVGDNRFNK